MTQFLEETWLEADSEFQAPPQMLTRTCPCRSQVEETIDFAVDRLVFNTAVLEEGMTVAEAGLETESNIDALVALDGGKRKRKKKVYTKPKKIKHKHKKRPMALIEYYQVEASSKVTKLKNECTKCPVGKCRAPPTHLSLSCSHLHGGPPRQNDLRPLR